MQRLSATLVVLATLCGFAALATGQAQGDFAMQGSGTTLSSAFNGFLTNYGGPWDKMDPNQPSFGLNVVRCHAQRVVAPKRWCSGRVLASALFLESARSPDDHNPACTPRATQPNPRASRTASGSTRLQSPSVAAPLSRPLEYLLAPR